MRKPRADEGDRQSPLNGLVEGGDERFELDGGQELNLVNQEDDARPLLLGRLAQPDEKIGEILTEVAAIPDALKRVHIEAAGDRALRRHRDRERLQDPRGSLRLVPPAFGRRDLEQRPSHELSHARPELRALRDLGLDRDPSRQPGALLERPEKNGLAHAAQAGDQQRLLRVAVAEPIQEHLERLKLVVATHERRRTRAGVRRVRIRSRIHPTELIELFRVFPTLINPDKRENPAILMGPSGQSMTVSRRNLPRSSRHARSPHPG